MKGSVLAHPEKNRPLSVEEYKRIQTFPDDWKVLGSVRTKYKLLGEAVPVKLSEAIAEQVKDFLRSKASIIT
jgi:DNA (cytosine-5)-methyltransferase 1